MTTLNSNAVAKTLQRLLKIPGATSISVRPSGTVKQKPDFDRSHQVRSKTRYLEFYSQLKDMPLAVTPETGNLLYMLVRSAHAETILEFGTSFGISTIYLASALRDNGGGRLITTEFEPSKIARATQHLTEAGLIDLVEIRKGDALETLKQNLPEQIDFVLLDGAKGIYMEVLNLLESHLKPGALIVADNTNYCPDYEDWVSDPANGYISTSIAEDVKLSMWTL